MMKPTLLLLVIALAFVFNVSARTILFERLTVSSDDQVDTEELLIEGILQNVFNNQLQLVDDSPNCDTPDSCCIEMMGHKLCFKATLGTNEVTISITLDGQEVFSFPVSASTEKCVTDNLPRGVKQACIEITNFDLSKHSGCVGYKVETSFKTYKGDIGCFQIESDMADATEKEAELTEVVVESTGAKDNILEIDTVLKFKRN